MFRASTLTLAAAVVSVVASAASACPMCAESVAADNRLPQAFMWSILFMLTVPAVVFTGFSIVIYRMIRKHDAAQLEYVAAIESATEPAATASDGSATVQASGGS